MEIYGTNIRVKPIITAEDETTTSKVVVIFGSGAIGSNYDSESIELLIYVYCPFQEWEIAGTQLRPFAIMSEIRKSLQNKKINGLGEIRYNSFDIANLTDQMGCYAMRFSINAFS